MNKLKDRNKNIIQSFLSILEIIIKIDWLKKFFTSNTKIIICIDISRIKINIPDIKCIIQWKIIDYSTSTTIF